MKSNKKTLSYKHDMLIAVVLAFVVVMVLTMYDLWQRSQIDQGAVVVDVPPVVIKPMDMKVFDRLREMN